jgi:hypothetical protein
MRGAVCFVVLAIVAVGVHALDGVSAQAVEPTKVLAEARAALGGEGRITAVRTFVANGRTRQVRGDNLVPIEFEIQVELPDKYSRRDEFPAQDAGPVTTGFSGDRLIQIPAPVAPPAAGGAPAANPAQQEAALRGRVMTAKQDFFRLMLGMFASSFDGFPLTFKYIGQAEAPQGQAHVLDAAGPGNFTARLFIDTATHLPLMVSWQQAAPPAPRRGGPPPQAPNAAPGGAPPQPPAPVENRLYFSDYRDVDGLRLPFRLRRAVGGETIEETTFDRFRINARVDPRRFVTN